MAFSARAALIQQDHLLDILNFVALNGVRVMSMEWVDGFDLDYLLALEMEIAGLYGLAAEYGVRALGILTVSDHIRRKEALSPEERQTGFDAMIEIAMETAARL